MSRIRNADDFLSRFQTIRYEYGSQPMKSQDAAKEGSAPRRLEAELFGAIEDGQDAGTAQVGDREKVLHHKLTTDGSRKDGRARSWKSGDRKSDVRDQTEAERGVRDARAPSKKRRTSVSSR